MGKQWHPLFAHLLGLLIQDYYEIRPEVPVGDLPRQGDLLIIRRHPGPEPPFVGLWMHLTDWNVVEFKGPTDYPEQEDLELLVHVGTGLTLKLNEERQANQQERLANRQVAFWYLVPNLGETFLEHVRGRVYLDYETGGLWRGKILGHPLFLLAYHDAAVEIDTIPLTLLDRDLTSPRALGELMVQQQALFHQFRKWVLALQPNVWQEIQQMASTRTGSGIFDWKAVFKVASPEDIEEMVRGLPFDELARLLPADRFDEFVRRLPADRCIEALGVEKALDALLANVPADKLQEMLQRRLKQE